jgi:hypothetical protein
MSQPPPSHVSAQTQRTPSGRGAHGAQAAPAATTTVDRKLQEVMGKWNRVISPDPQQNVLLAVAIQMGELKLQMCRIGSSEETAFAAVCGIYDKMLEDMDIRDLAEENPELYEQLVVAAKHMIGTYGHAPLASSLPRAAVDDTPPSTPTVHPTFSVPDFARRPPSGATSSF